MIRYAPYLFLGTVTFAQSSPLSLKSVCTSTIGGSLTRALSSRVSSRRNTIVEALCTPSRGCPMPVPYVCCAGAAHSAAQAAETGGFTVERGLPTV